MPDLQEVRIGALNGQPEEQVQSVVRQLNEWSRQISNESITRVQKNDSGNTAIVSGKLPYENGYGTLYYDSDGVPSIVIGVLPDGTMGMVVAKSGVDVLSLFS